MSKVAIFSDFHLGIKQDSAIWHEIALTWCDWFVSEVKKNDIDTVVFLGDFFHTRNSISANTLHVASKILDKLKDFKASNLKKYKINYEKLYNEWLLS